MIWYFTKKCLYYKHFYFYWNISNDDFILLLYDCGSGFILYFALECIETCNVVWTCRSSALIKPTLASKLLTRIAVIGLRTLWLTDLAWHVLAHLTSIVLANFPENVLWLNSTSMGNLFLPRDNLNETFVSC